MKVLMDKKHLEIFLSKLKAPEKPKAGLEQYTIPSGLAAEMLNLAFIGGDIAGKTVFDLGCGTCRLAIGAAIMGAKKVVGIDIDENMIKLAKENCESAGVEVDLVCDGIENFRGECDTVIQNPPFGMRGRTHTDRLFLKKALECGRKVYSLHRGGYEGEKESRTREFLRDFIEKSGGIVLAVKEFKFDVPYMFKFHRKPKVSYNVDLFVIEKVAT
jgi:putative methylase